MIRAVTIKNFKNIQDQRIELERLTVFVGLNGCGKTSVLEAVNWAIQGLPNSQGFAFSLSPQNSRLDWLYTRGGSGPLSIDCETDDGQLGIMATIVKEQPSPQRSMPSRLWKYDFQPSPVETFEAAQNSTRPLVLLRLEPARLGAPSYSHQEKPTIQPDGSGLASVLAFMALNDPDSFDELIEFVRELIPQVRRIRFHKTLVSTAIIEDVQEGMETRLREKLRLLQGEAILLDYQHAKGVAAHTASEGTLLILGLLTVLLGPDRPKSLLMDDIEHGLHPWAQKQLISVIGRIMDRFPDLQILATAHSPYLLNYLAPEQVRIMATDPEGHALCGRLTDHPKFQTWKDEMAPGELWSLFGEKWLAGAEAAK